MSGYPCPVQVIIRTCRLFVILKLSKQTRDQPSFRRSPWTKMLRAFICPNLHFLEYIFLKFVSPKLLQIKDFIDGGTFLSKKY